MVAAGAAAASGQQVYRGSDLSYAMEITLSRAALGRMRKIPHPQPGERDTCKGGVPGPVPAQDHTTCSGSGAVHMRQGFFQHPADLPPCQGIQRRSFPEPCTASRQQVPARSASEIALEFKIPGRHQRGTADPLGQQWQDRHQQRPPGDLYIEIRIEGTVR